MTVLFSSRGMLTKCKNKFIIYLLTEKDKKMDINEQKFKSELSQVFKENRLAHLLSIDISEKFLTLTKRMLEENEKFNLTAITEPSKIILNHYADCVTLAEKLPTGAKIIDVGCGAGFPTLPLAIVRGDVQILAMDSTAKRIAYVEETAKLLGLSNVMAVSMRAEECARMPDYREKFDFAVARAVAEMRVLSELCLPLVKPSGEMIAMKGKNAEFELSSAKKAIALTGNSETLSHPLIIVKKKTKTPAVYPRPYAQISKKPL